MEILNEAASFMVAFGGFVATIAVFAKSPVGRFVAKVLKREGQDLMLQAAKEANEPLDEKINGLSNKVEALDSYTRYHLGPNGTSEALHVRIDSLEWHRRQDHPE